MRDGVAAMRTAWVSQVARVKRHLTSRTIRARLTQQPEVIFSDSDLAREADTVSDLIPDAPLPLPRRARVAVVSDDDGLASGLNQLWAAHGRAVTQLSWRTLTQAPERRLRQEFDVVLLCVPWHRLRSQASELADLLRGVVVVSCISEAAPDAEDSTPTETGRESVTELLDRHLPGSRVVGALQLLQAEHLSLAAVGALETDVPVLGDDLEAVDLVSALVDELPGLEAVHAGSLRQAAGVEGLAAMIRQIEADTGELKGVRFGDEGQFRIIP